jgi:hypothetical protein
VIVNEGSAPVVSIIGGFAESRAVSKSLYLQAGVARSPRPFGPAAFELAGLRELREIRPLKVAIFVQGEAPSNEATNTTSASRYHAALGYTLRVHSL